MTETTTDLVAAPHLDEGFISSLLAAAAQDPSVEPALLADFDGTVKALGLNSPVSGKLSKEGYDYTFTFEGGSKTFSLAPDVAADGELSDRELDVVSGGGDDAKKKKTEEDGQKILDVFGKIVDFFRSSHMS